MAAGGDVEQHGDAHETTSLLNNDELTEWHECDPEVDQVRATRLTWKILWVILAIACLIVFIKGWVDTGRDVDVSISVFLT
jgi:hypothetical protein